MSQEYRIEAEAVVSPAKELDQVQGSNPAAGDETTIRKRFP